MFEYGYEDESMVFQQHMADLESQLEKNDMPEWQRFEVESGDLWRELGVEDWREAFKKDAMACIAFREELESIIKDLDKKDFLDKLKKFTDRPDWDKPIKRKK